MRALLFFLFVSFFLIKGGNLFGRDIYHEEEDIVQLPSSINPQNVVVHLHHSVLKKTSVKEDKESILSVENEDTQMVVARKYVLLTSYILTLSFVFILSYFYSGTKNRLSFCDHFSSAESCIYIKQRVLRI